MYVAFSLFGKYGIHIPKLNYNYDTVILTNSMDSPSTDVHDYIQTGILCTGTVELKWDRKCYDLEASRGRGPLEYA